MNVGMLIKCLKNYPDDWEVFLNLDGDDEIMAVSDSIDMGRDDRKQVYLI